MVHKLGDKIRGSTLYLYRFNNTNEPSAREAKNGKPCLLCQHTLKAAGVSKVVYIENDGTLSVLKNRDMITLTGDPVFITRQFLEQFGENHCGKFKIQNYMRK